MLRTIALAAASYAAYRMWDRIRAENAADKASSASRRKLLPPPADRRDQAMDEALAPLGVAAD